MAATFRPRPVHDPFGDPALFVPFATRRRALLFDLGDLSPLAPRDLLKISHVFVSHTHMDHFIGFDRLLRLLLGRDREVHLFGPAGFLENVAGKLAGYTWNLVGGYGASVTLVAHEVRRDTILRTAFRCRDRFRPAGPPESRPFSGVLLEEPDLTVRAALLDHGVPCLGFALAERYHIHILPTELAGSGLVPGPWLGKFKAALFRDDPPETSVEAAAAGGGRRTFRLDELAARIVRIAPGQRIAYVTDAADTPENRVRILDLARGASHLFIEAAFLEADRDQARRKGHLTARRAGWLAGRSGAKRLTVFHFSPRYEENPEALRQEAEAAREAAEQDRRSPESDEAETMGSGTAGPVQRKEIR
jgi:ribonuclease Z